MKIPRIAYAAYGFAILIVVLDQLTKAWMIDGLSLQEVGRVFVLPPVLNFSWVENTGVSFGLFSGGEARWVLSIFSVIVTIGLVMGGAVGNVIDRVRFGYVVDFIDFSGTGVFPWVFNIADSAITVGVVLLILDSLLSDRPAQVGAANEKS